MRPLLQVCFSEGGVWFAAVGQGGMAAAWRLDAPQFTRSDSGPLARSEWCHQANYNDPTPSSLTAAPCPWMIKTFESHCKQRAAVYNARHIPMRDVNVSSFGGVLQQEKGWCDRSHCHLSAGCLNRHSGLSGHGSSRSSDRSSRVIQVLSKRGVAIAFVGGSSSVIAAGGYCPVGGNIVLWDSLAPISTGPIAYLTHHTPLVTALQVCSSVAARAPHLDVHLRRVRCPRGLKRLPHAWVWWLHRSHVRGARAQVLPGGRLLAAADEAGAVSVSDLRMMGTNRKALLWQVRCMSFPILQVLSSRIPSRWGGYLAINKNFDTTSRAIPKNRSSHV